MIYDCRLVIGEALVVLDMDRKPMYEARKGGQG